MGYYRYRLKCPDCGEEWNSFFCSVDMSQGLMECPKVKTHHKPEKIANDWKMENGSWMNESFFTNPPNK